MAELSENGSLNRVQKMEMFRDDAQQLDTPENIVRKAVERKYPRLNFDESRRIVTQLVSSPADYKIVVSGDEVRVDTLNEYVADSIERINAGSSEYGASSESEYFGWIKEGQDVIQHMNDGEITEADLEEKHKLLHDFQQREVDLMTCISLYQRCNLDNPKIKQKYDELNKKLMRLREIRSAVENSTKDKADKEKQQEQAVREDYISARIYLQFLAMSYQEIQENRQIVSQEERQRLKVLGSSSVNAAYILGSIRRRIEQQRNYRESLAEHYMMKKQENKTENRESIEYKLSVLSGRRAPVRQEPEYDYEKTRARAFDMDKYMQLKKLMERSRR